MSNATSTIQHDNPGFQRVGGFAPGVHDLRQGGAGFAPGFAQVLQAFDPVQNPDSSTADSDTLGERAADAAESKEDAAEPSNPEDQVEQTGESDAAAGSDGEGEQGTTSDKQQATDGQEVSETTTEVNTPVQDKQADAMPGTQPQTADAAPQTRVHEAARLELLVHRGDLAKLSMRGLVRSLRADASPDLTTIAVQTRLGETSTNGTPGVQVPVPASPKPDGVQPDVAPPSQQRVGPPVNESSSALSDTVPTSPRGGGETQRSAIVQPLNTPDAAPKVDQARVDMQQARSVRADAGGSAQANIKADLTRMASIQNGSVPPSAQRVEGALTSRAISGVESAGSPATLKGTQTQAQKLDASAKDAGAQRAAVMAQVQRGLAQMLRSGRGGMTIKLTPGHLGEVRIQMKQDGERIGLRLTASSEQAREMLSSGSKELMHQLLGKGIPVERVQIDLQASDSNGNSGGAQSGDADPGRGESHGQGDTPGQHAGHKGNEPVVPLTHEPAGPLADEHGPIWTELGLDAIA